MLNIDNPDVNFSLKSGFRFRFTIDGKELLYLVSAWTGKESLFYDSEQISQKRTYKMKTSQSFLIDNVPYKITLNMESLLRGNWHCCLLRNDRMVQCFDVYLEDKDGLTKRLLYGVGLGFLLAIIPKYLWIIYLPLIAFVAVMLTMNNLSLKVKVRLGS